MGGERTCSKVLQLRRVAALVGTRMVRSVWRVTLLGACNVSSVHEASGSLGNASSERFDSPPFYCRDAVATELLMYQMSTI